MEQDDVPLSGDVEIDETYHGGTPRAYMTGNKLGSKLKTYKPRVLGAVERGGRVKAMVVKSRTTPDVEPHVNPVRSALVDDLHGRVEGLHG
jgi:ISXO2-like transposase domain